MPQHNYEAGLYMGTIVDQCFKTVGQKNTPAFELRVRIESRLNPTTNVAEPVTQSVVWVTTFLTEKTKKFADPKLQSLGWSGKSYKELDPTINGFTDLRGKQHMFYCSGLKPGKKYPDWDVSTPQTDNQRRDEYQQGVSSMLDVLMAAVPTVATTTGSLNDVPF